MLTFLDSTGIPQIQNPGKYTRQESLTPSKYDAAGPTKFSRQTAAIELITDDTELNRVQNQRHNISISQSALFPENFWHFSKSPDFKKFQEKIGETTASIFSMYELCLKRLCEKW